MPKRPRKTRKLNTKEKSIITVENPVPLFRLPPAPLADDVSTGLSHLCSADPVLASIIASYRSPSFRSFPILNPFHSLVRIILYQQLSFKSATVIYTRFLSLFNNDDLLPHSVLEVPPKKLRQAGVSHSKISCLLDLASQFRDGILSDSALLATDDDSLLSMLTQVKGIGVWTINVFMIFSLNRLDVLPATDVAVRKGVQKLYGLKKVPMAAQMEELCEKWRPYRSFGTWYMWMLVDSKSTPTMISLDVPNLS